MAGSTTLNGNTVLGSSSGGQTLIVNALTTFAATAGPITANAAVIANQGLTVAGSTTLLQGSTVVGTAAGGQTLTINAATIFSASAGSVTANAAVTANQGLTVRGSTMMTGNTTCNGSTVLGNSSSDYCTVNCAASFAGPSSFTGPSSFIGPSTFTGPASYTGPVALLGPSTLPSSSSSVTFQRRLGPAPVVTGTALGQLLFTGWDGAADGVGAAIRSVYTV